MDARYPVLRPWTRSAEVRGEYRYENWNTTGGLYCAQSVFLKKFGHRLLLSLSAQPDNV